MERKANKTDGRQGERKKDDCGCNCGQFKVVSHEVLGVAVIRNHLSIIKPAALLFRLFPEMMGRIFYRATEGRRS